MTVSNDSLNQVPLASSGVTVKDSPLASSSSAALPEKRVRPVRAWRMPGEGPTAALSIASVIALAALWWIATHLHWLPPLFLPTPEAVWSAFIDACHGRIQGGLPLSQHLAWSALRVFGEIGRASCRERVWR